MCRNNGSEVVAVPSPNLLLDYEKTASGCKMVYKFNYKVVREPLEYDPFNV